MHAVRNRRSRSDRARRGCPVLLLFAAVLLILLVPAASLAAAPSASRKTPDPKKGAKAREAKRIEQLTRLLYSQNAQERSAAASALLKSAHPLALRTLLEALGKPDHGQTKISVLTAFSVNRDDRAVRQIMDLLTSKNRDVQQHAQNALVGIRTPRALETILAALKEKKRPAAARLLLFDVVGRVRARAPLPHLIQLLSHKNPQLRRAAHRALQAITEERLGPDPDAWTKYAESVKSKSREEWLLHVIGVLQGRNKTLREVTQKQWIDRLKARSKPNDLLLLKEALASSLPGVRAYAALEMGRHGLREAGKELVVALRDGVPEVRCAAADALGRIHYDQAIPHLIECLDDPDPSVQVEAAQALGGLKAAEGVRALIAHIDHDDPVLTPVVVAALGDIGARSAVPQLSALLKDNKANVKARAAAAGALGRLKDKRGLAALIAATKDANDPVRWSAADALGGFAEPAAVPALAGLLAGDKNAQVRETAAVALGRIGTPETVAPLTDALLDAEHRVSSRALKALVRVLAPKPERFEELARRLIQKRDLARARSLLAAAIERVGKTPNRAELARRLKSQKASVLFKLQDWKAARAVYQELFDAAPSAPIISRLAACLEELKDHDALLALYARARKAMPGRSADWWTGSLAAVRKLAGQKKHAQVVSAVGALAKEDPKLGGDAFAKPLQELRARSRAALKPDKPETAKVSPEILKQLALLLKLTVRDKAARQKVIAEIVKRGEKAAGPLVKLGLGHKNPEVQAAVMDALEKITRHPFKLPANPTPKQRQKAIDEWRRWWEGRKKSGPSTR